MTFGPEDPRGPGILLRPSARVFVLSFILLLSASRSFARSITIYNRQPDIRVSLTAHQKDLSLRIQGKCSLIYQDVKIASLTNSSITFHFTPQGSPVANLPDQQINFYSPIDIEPADTLDPIISPSDPLGVMFNGETYPGTVEIMPESDGSFRLINRVPLETYLRGVVPNELINNLKPDELQACMAQAIAARNYAFFRMSNIDSFANDPASKGFDVYSDTRDQVYSGIERYKPIADTAVELTRGMIVEYNGEPARCFFFSTCGGHTASVQEVWQGQPALPYLRGVSDIDPATGEPFCIFNPNFYWSVTFSGHELTELVKRNLAMASPNYGGVAVYGNVEALRVIDRFNSGRVDSLEIKMDDGHIYYVRGDRTRYLFKRSNGSILNSSMFTIETLRKYGGGISRVILKGKGNGHGVGMCQWGALGMSRLGYSFRQILSHYYPGTVIKKVY